MIRTKYRFFITAILFINILVITSQLYAQTITGRDWIKVCDTSSFSPRSMHQVVVFKGKLYLIDGRDNKGNINDVWCSEDGANWSLVKNKMGAAIDYGASVVVFHDTLWMNANKTIWNSPDGITWKKITTINQIPRYGKSMVVFNNKMWLIGGWENGFTDDVWLSSDGLHWDKVKTNNCFTKRADQCVVVLDNKMWLIAGQSGPNKSDIWCSNDGIEWTLVADAPFTPRHSSQAVVYNNKIWIIAGFAMDNAGKAIRLADVWSSSDCKIWDEVISYAPFGGRQEHQTVVYKNHIWLIGGLTGIHPDSPHIYKNDVWCTDAFSTGTDKIKSMQLK